MVLTATYKTISSLHAHAPLYSPNINSYTCCQALVSTLFSKDNRE